MITETAIIQSVITASLFALIYGSGKMVSIIGLTIIDHFSPKKQFKDESGKLHGLLLEVVVATAILLFMQISFMHNMEDGAFLLLAQFIFSWSIFMFILSMVLMLILKCWPKRKQGANVALDNEEPRA